MQLNVGVFGIGLAAYWPQFPDLKPRLENYQSHVEKQLVSIGVQVTSAGLVDDAPSAVKAGELFARSNVDLQVCYVGTYATSSQVLPVVQKARVPVLVLNLQPAAALDYENTDTGEWLANCSTCCVPELCNAFTRARIDFQIVSGMLYDSDGAWEEIRGWCRAAGTARALRSARIGFLGHTYPGMLDMYSDFTAVHAQLESHIEILEMDDLAVRVAAATNAEIAAKIAETREVFDLAPAVSQEDLGWPARVAVGLDRLVKDFDLNGLTYYYRGLEGNEFERLGAALILGNSLLNSRGIPTSGEGDLKTCIGMLLMSQFGAGGAFTEFYAMDFNDNFILMGHDGPGHVSMGARKPILRNLPLYHGKRGSGISVEFSVKPGPVTIVGVTQDAEGKLKMIGAQGESLAGPILKIGNTNSRLRFSLPPAEFINRWCEQGPTHHCALGVGHQLRAFHKLSRLMHFPLLSVGGQA